MNQVKMVNDLSTYTKIPTKVFNTLVEKEMLCIGSAIHDAKLANEDVVIIDIGIGSLSIELSSMQCKFLPNKTLKTTIKKCINGADPLEYTMEQALINRLVSICDEEL